MTFRNYKALEDISLSSHLARYSFEERRVVALGFLLGSDIKQ